MLIGARRETSSGVSGMPFVHRTTMGLLRGRTPVEIAGTARIAPCHGPIVAEALEVRTVHSRHRWLLNQIHRERRGQNLDSCAGRTINSSWGTVPLVRKASILREMSSAAPLCGCKVCRQCIVSFFAVKSARLFFIKNFLWIESGKLMPHVYITILMLIQVAQVQKCI